MKNVLIVTSAIVTILVIVLGVWCVRLRAGFVEMTTRRSILHPQSAQGAQVLRILSKASRSCKFSLDSAFRSDVDSWSA
jgi:hypothetical protein